jgi:hypothetical protein
MNLDKINLSAIDFHPHLRDAKAGTTGKVFVFPYDADWEGKCFAEKEVTVYYKRVNGELVVLTVKARYGESFLKGGGEGANRI